MNCSIYQSRNLGDNLLAVAAYKVLLVGDASVGKSSLIRRLLLDEFDEEYTATVGVDLSAVALNIDTFTPVILTVIDLGGQASFDELRTKYYKGAHYAILVYDITAMKTFESIPYWLEGLTESIKTIDGRTLPCILLGNKADMTHQREVIPAVGSNFADSHGFPFYETSAKTGFNVKDIFLRIARSLYATYPPVRPKLPGQKR